jgi:hypothetical protein
VQFTHGGLGNTFEFLAKKIGPESVPFLGPEFLLGSVLEVGGLGGDEEGVDLGFERSAEEAEIGRQTQKAEEVQGLLGGNGVGVEQDAVGATDLIGEHAGFFLDQFLAGVAFEVD